MITAEVQQVTTRSKAQQTQWVRQAAKEWIEKTNNTNFDPMNTEMKDITIGASTSSKPIDLLDDDPTWQALTSCEVSMPLNKLLHLLPRFKDTVVSLITGKDQTNMPVHLAE